ncbi:cytochrome P450 [Camillea tinctor]|nr:cytochrome P450 [Camillea tinctor]
MMLLDLSDLRRLIHIGSDGFSYEPLHWMWQAASLLGIGYFIWGIGIAVYRVTLHPLARIPGPRVATMSYWYEIYYEVVLEGQYFKRIKNMHSEYGPIVRINPDEVHFDDPDFIGNVYPTSGRKTNKPHWVGQRSGTPNSIVATMDHVKHRLRRRSINDFFSAARIGKFEPIFKKNVQRILQRWNKVGGSNGEVLNMHTVFQAYASDNITTYAFGDCFNFLDDEHWGAEYFSSQEKYFKLTHIFGSFPIIMRLVNNMPTWLLGMFIHNLSSMSEKQGWRIKKVREIRNSPDPNAIESTIFEGIIASNLPDEEKTDVRMAHDAQLIVLAGESTTGHSLCAILFELLSHPDDYRVAKNEIISALSDDDFVPSYAKIQSLPYFNAVIQEGLRLHPGVLSRMTRISPEKTMMYTDKRRGRTYTLPAGTQASMTTLITHTNPAIFDDPHEFHPQRWIDNPKLNRALIAFSRGSRNCVGQEFAHREMAMILAAILRHYDIYSGQNGPTLELYDTIRERDIVANSEMIIPMPAKGSYGLRVRFRV